MGPSGKRFLNAARSSRTASTVLLPVVRRFEQKAARLAEEIRTKFRANGATVEYDGCELHFPRDVGVGICSRIYWEGEHGYEAGPARTLRTLIEKSGTFLDVGANVGLYSVLATKWKPNVAVEAFEPIPAIAEQARAFIEANASSADVTLHELACSDRDGVRDLYLPRLDADVLVSPAGTLRPDSWQQSGRHETVAVQTRRLDSVFEGRSLHSPLTIKIDVEDHQAAVLEGAGDTIARYQPAIVCEVLPRPPVHAEPGTDRDRAGARMHGNQPTAEIFDSIGYSMWAIGESASFMRFGRDDLLAERPFTDFLCIPESWVPSSRNYLHLSEVSDLVFPAASG